MNENETSDSNRSAKAYFFRASTEEFYKIPGSPIAYWLGKAAFSAFESGRFLRDIVTTRVGMATGDNDRFVRCWQEVSLSKIGFGHAPKEPKFKNVISS